MRAATRGAVPAPVAFISVSVEGRLSTLGRRSIDAERIAAAGVHDLSPRAGGTTVVDPEQLLRLDPPMIVLASAGVDGDGPDAVACGAAEEVPSEAHLQRLYGMPLRRVRVEQGGRTIDAAVPLPLTR